MRKLIALLILIVIANISSAGIYYTQDEEGAVTRTKGDTPYPENAIWQTTINHNVPVGEIAIVDGVLVRVPVILPVPSLTPLQFRLGLLTQGITEAQIITMLESIEDPTEQAVALLTFNNASVIKRDNAMVVSMGATMGFTELQMDEFFRTASEIE